MTGAINIILEHVSDCRIYLTTDTLESISDNDTKFFEVIYLCIKIMIHS